MVTDRDWKSERTSRASGITRLMRLRLHAALALLVCLLGLSTSAYGYSLLTHEQLIDLTWDTSIVPLLLSRYPTLTPAELEHARAYAYGGCVIQDIGYYPFSSRKFGDLAGESARCRPQA